MKSLIDILRLYIITGLLFFSAVTCFAQYGFVLDKNKKRDAISFKLLNNLVVIPVEVNGAELTFLLDTGVSSTVIFGFAIADSLQLENAAPVEISGLGKEGSITAFKSKNNTIRIGDAIDKEHNIYIIFDESLNFSPRMGIPIHGIVGYDFFKKFIVKTNYISKRIVFWDPKQHSIDKCRSCEEFNISLYNRKPFIDIDLTVRDSVENVKLLLDSGSSDALWLFDEEIIINSETKNYFNDFLGLGLSGNIHGKRSRIPEATLGNFKLKGVNVAFPEAESIVDARNYKERDGSLGGEFLKRFTVIIDYPNRKLILKKNRNFSDPFYYNMSGLTIQHDGIELVKQEKQRNNLNVRVDNASQSFGATGVNLVTEYEFLLVPKFIVAAVREDSPAALAGVIVGDEIISVNGEAAHRIKLVALNSLFSSKEGKTIILRIRRNNSNSTVRFTLKKVI